MAALFRPTFRCKTTGEVKRVKKWYAKVRFADGIVRVGVTEVGGNCVQFGVVLSDGGDLLRQEVVMSEPLSPEQEAKAQELAARITARSADTILEMARRLVATTDDTLFGDTEFALRAQAQGIVADAYTEHLPQKVATPLPPSTARTAKDAPPSTTTAKKRSRHSGGRSGATGPTTTVEPAATAPAPGTPASD